MSIHRWMDKEAVVHLHNGILQSHKENEIMLFAATWIQLEMITLKSVRKQKTNIWYHFIWILKMAQVNLSMKKKQYRHVAAKGERRIGSLGLVLSIYTREINNKVSIAQGWKRILKKCITESLFYIAEIHRLLTNYS